MERSSILIWGLCHMKYVFFEKLSDAGLPGAAGNGIVMVTMRDGTQGRVVSFFKIFFARFLFAGPVWIFL